MAVVEQSLVRAAIRDVLSDPMRVLRAGFVLAVVPITGGLCWSALVFATLLFDPMYLDVFSYDTYRTLTEFVAPLTLVATLAAFGFLDALFVAAIASDDGLLASLGRVRMNPPGVALWMGAFVVAFWPFRLVVLPQWTLGWAAEALAVVNGDLSWLALPAVAGAVGLVTVLSSATFFLAPLAVVDAKPPGRALRINVRLLRAVPGETALSVLAGVAAVVAGFLALCLGLLFVGFSLGLWIFGLVLFPVAVVFLVAGFVALAAAYAFARTLLVETYRRGRERVATGSANTSGGASIDPL